MNGNIYLLKMGENFTGLSAVGKKTEKKKWLKIKKILSLRSKLLRILQRDPVCRGRKNTFHIITQGGVKKKISADVMKYEGGLSRRQ